MRPPWTHDDVPVEAAGDDLQVGHGLGLKRECLEIVLASSWLHLSRPNALQRYGFLDRARPILCIFCKCLSSFQFRRISSNPVYTASLISNWCSGTKILTYRLHNSI
jgi:hypothetical protein